MNKPQNTTPTSHEIANAIYDANELAKDAKSIIAEMSLLNNLHEITSNLSDSICVWDEEKEDWTPSSKIFMDAYSQDIPEGHELEQLNYIYEECFRNGLDDDSLELIDRARQRFNRKKRKLLPRFRFKLPREVYEHLHVAFFGLIQLVATAVGAVVSLAVVALFIYLFFFEYW